MKTAPADRCGDRHLQLSGFVGFHPLEPGVNLSTKSVPISKTCIQLKTNVAGGKQTLVGTCSLHGKVQGWCKKNVSIQYFAICKTWCLFISVTLNRLRDRLPLLRQCQPRHRCLQRKPVPQSDAKKCFDIAFCNLQNFTWCLFISGTL